MVVEDNQSKTPERLPLKQIPDAWATSGRCPACGAAPLQLVHLASPADYLLCPRCELSFEVEQNAGNIRVKNIPDGLGFAEEQLRFHWIKPTLLRELLDSRRAPVEQKAAGALSALPALSDEEVWNRMLSLYHLGNKPKMVELILMQAGATHEQAQAAFVRLKKVSEQETRGQIRKFWLFGGVVALLAILSIGGWALMMNRINAQLQQGLSNPSTGNRSSSPLQLLNDLPDAIKPAFMKSAPLQVDQGSFPPRGTKLADCPTSTVDAAALFGGAASAWSKPNQPNAWQMVETGAPITIQLPAGMVAGLIDNKSYGFLSVTGPATIYNVNFVAIVCN